VHLARAYGNGAVHSTIIGKNKTHSSPNTSFNSVPEILRRHVVEGDLVNNFFFVIIKRIIYVLRRILHIVYCINVYQLVYVYTHNSMRIQDGHLDLRKTYYRLRALDIYVYYTDNFG
jgi:hypothetical protein